jgi:Ca2+/Na+ antiporter
MINYRNTIIYSQVKWIEVIMPSAEATLPTAAISRLARLSRVMEMVIWFGIALIAVLTIAALLIPDWTRNIALAKLGQAGVALPITPLGQSVAGLVLAIPVGVMIYGLLAARRMFREFACGEIFSERTARFLQIFAATVLAQAPLGPLTSAGFSAALSLGNPPGQRAIAIAFSVNDYFALIVGGVLFAAATVMREAARLADENKGFV